MVKFYKKYVFLQALLLTIVMFIIGMYIGISFEDRNLDNAQAFYSQSEVSLMDIMALNDLLDSGKVSCDLLKQTNFDFANKIYHEAALLDDYEKSGRITDNFLYVHRKYDLLRTVLWMNAIKVKDQCNNNFSTVVYLYNYEVEDLVIKAEQTVWSKLLYELKQEQGDNILLIPIARSDDFISLEALTNSLNITQYPAVIVDEEHVFYGITSIEEIRNSLSRSE
mgnify:CR=1 FL=1